MASFGGIFISIGIISPLCRGSLFERRESLFLRYPVCTGKYFSVNISAQERLHLVIERYPKLFRCLQDFQFSLSNVSLPIYNEKEKEGRKEREDENLLIKHTCTVHLHRSRTVSSILGNETTRHPFNSSRLSNYFSTKLISSLINRDDQRGGAARNPLRRRSQLTLNSRLAS